MERDLDDEQQVDLDVRRADLLSFAAELSGDPATAELLVAQAIRHWRSLPEEQATGTDTGHDELRAWVTRGYLSEGMILGRPPAADVDDPVPAEAPSDGDALDDRLRVSSKLRRATLLLRYRVGLGDEEIARTVGSTPDGIAAYLAHVLDDLGVGSGGYREDDLRDRLARHREAVAQDLAGTADEADGVALADGFAWVDIVGPKRRVELAPTEPSAAGANPLLDLLTDSLEGPAPHPTPGPAPTARSRRRRRWVWLGLVLLIVATFAVVVALVVGTRSDPAGGGTESARHTLTTPTTAAAVATAAVPPLPSPITAQLPGTRVLGDYAGAGARTLAPAPAAARPGFELAIGLACRGAGPVSTGSVLLADCSVPAVGPVSAGAAPLTVQAPAGTRWRAVLVEQPVVDTSGSLRSPPDPSLADPKESDVIAAARGVGAATVRLPTAGPGVHALRVSLLCTGPGVELSGAGHAADGAYARSCVPGWSYEFDLAAVALPAQLRLAATPATAWQLSVTLR